MQHQIPTPTGTILVIAIASMLLSLLIMVV